jgi:hypothetical protein
VRRHERHHRLGEQLQQALAVGGDGGGDLARLRHGLVEEDAPGVAVAIDEVIEGHDAVAQGLGGRGGALDGLGDRGDQRLARRRHARLVKPLLVAEIGVQQGLLDADLQRDVLHRHGGEAAAGELLARHAQHLLLAVGPRQAAARGRVVDGARHAPGTVAAVYTSVNCPSPFGRPRAFLDGPPRVAGAPAAF